MATADGGQKKGDAFAETLQGAVEEAHRESGADIVALYPFDGEAETFYAPVAIGLGEGAVVNALSDMNDQWRRYQTDKTQGKVPDDVTPGLYGSNAWLLATRRPLIAADATRDVDSSFVRRNRVYSVVGLPLLDRGRVVALLYLNYTDKDGHERIDVSDAAYQDKLTALAASVGATVDTARRDAEAAMLRSLSDLIGMFAASPSSTSTSQDRIGGALGLVIAATGFDAAALYAPDDSGSLVLGAARGCPSLASSSFVLGPTPLVNAVRDNTLRALLAQDDLVPVIATAPRGQTGQGVLVLADRDAFALQRRIPSSLLVLQTATDLLGERLRSERLIEELDETNRTLGAVTRLSTRLLQPGSSQEAAQRAAVAALTDPSLPELDFEFAVLFQLESSSDGRLVVSSSVGATASTTIDSVSDGTPGATRRMPRWVSASTGVRHLDPHDVVAYAATRRRAVVVAALDRPDDDHFITGYPEALLERMDAKLLAPDGATSGHVHVVRLRESADRAPLHTGGESDSKAIYRVTDEITLDAALFASYGHGSLVRVFVPFGADESGTRATGVLEAGFHISHENKLERMQIEALRACAATIASTIETARLYEDVAGRARQLEIVTEVGRAIAGSIDLDQTLALVARNMTRSVDASICLIALLDEDGSAWYGAAASDSEALWRQRRVERPTPSIVFEVADRGQPLVVEDAENDPLVSAHVARILGIQSLMVLPLLTGEGEALGVVFLGQRDRRRVFTTAEVQRSPLRRRRAAHSERRHPSRLWPMGAEGLPASPFTQGLLQLPHARRRVGKSRAARSLSRGRARRAGQRRPVLLGLAGRTRARRAGARARAELLRHHLHRHAG